MKRTLTEEQREQARQAYLDRRGVPESYRWTPLPGSDDRSVPRSYGWQTRRKGLSALSTQLPSSSKKTQILRWMWAEDCEQIRFANKRLSTLLLRIVATPSKLKKNGGGIRRCFIPPRISHDTLQPQNESIIVGYYTSAEVFPKRYPEPQTQITGGKSLWQEATVFIVQAQEI